MSHMAIPITSETGLIKKCVGFILDSVALRQIYFQVFHFNPVNYHSTSAPHSFINRPGLVKQVHS